MRQNRVHRARNFALRSQLKTTIKKAVVLMKEKKTEEATKFLPIAYKVIDTAVKKNILHANNGDRKKSQLAKALNALTAK